MNTSKTARELTEAFGEYSPYIRKKGDGGYGWLENENDVCVVFPDTAPEFNIEVELRHDGTASVFFAACYKHYLDCEARREEMHRLLSDVLKSRKCAAVLYYGEEKKRLACAFIDADEVSLPVRDIFAHVLKHEKLWELLDTNGGEARFTFRDGTLSRTVRLGVKSGT